MLITCRVFPLFNCLVPTPFYHLNLAYQLIAHPRLQPDVLSLLRDQTGAFLLGNTAPDVQVISAQTRSETHFFTVPIQDERALPWKYFFRQYPRLVRSGRGDPSRASFIAGYICHLQADWLWVLSIFQPIFGPSQTWDTFSNRLFLHNILRAYLDIEALNGLPYDTPELINDTPLDDWLPFVDDIFLDKWRRFLVHQLQPGVDVKTVDVFAARHGMNPDEFRSIVCSEPSMDEKIFTRIPRASLSAYRQQVIELNLALLDDYLNYFTKSAGVGDLS